MPGKSADLAAVQRDALQRGGYWSYRLPPRAQMPKLAGGGPAPILDICHEVLASL